MATIAKTAKVVNYTVEQTETAKREYAAGTSVEKIAEMLGKSARSVVAKLSRELKGTEHEYKAKTYATKTGEKVAKKDETADAIGLVLKLTEPEIESLTKANKTALVKIFAALANSVPMTPENSPAE
jgi:hypothetical protein